MSFHKDLTTIKKRIWGFLRKLRKSLYRLRRCPYDDARLPRLARREEKDMRIALQELRRSLPKAVRDRFDATFGDLAEAVNDTGRPPGGSDDISEIFKWPDFRQIRERARAMFRECGELAESKPNDYTLKPLTDDDAHDGIVRALAQREKHQRRRLREKYAHHPLGDDMREVADSRSAAKLRSAKPKRGAHWEDVSNEMRGLWLEMVPEAIEQAMDEAILDRGFVCVKEGYDFAEWIKLPWRERPQAVFLLTKEGKRHAKSLGFLADTTVAVTPPTTEQVEGHDQPGGSEECGSDKTSAKHNEPLTPPARKGEATSAVRGDSEALAKPDEPAGESAHEKSDTPNAQGCVAQVDTPTESIKPNTSNKHAERLKPSHAKAKALHEWAMDNILRAESMTYSQLFDALQNDPRCAGEGLPDNAASFARYCRAAGIQRNSPRRSRGPTRSVRRASDL